MGMLDFFKPKPEAAPVLPKLASAPDVKGAPGTRMYHEYFVDEAPANGRIGWQARVYAADGTAHSMTGSAETDRQARIDAITWAESKKVELRGAP
ncbi:MAG: hypothetical protein V4633_13515 [Pseudomonadota bacterium]